MRTVRIAALATAASLFAAPASAAPLQERAVIDRQPEDCQTQITPEVTPPLALTTDPVLPLEARVMVEAEHLATAKEHLAVTKEAFALIGIKLKVRYDVVTVPDTWDDKGDQLTHTEIFDFMRAHYGGQRPPGVDVVYFITRFWDGGIADCVGGVRSPESAFALGSIDYAVLGEVPAPTADEGVIAAHELGHLLGAHHHYSNCTEALPSGALRGDFNPCTTMSPLAATASSTFSLLERSFIRYYVEQYAKG